MKAQAGPRKVVYKNPYQQIYEVHVEFEGGKKDLFVTDYGPRAALIVHGPEGILLTRQYRYLIDRVSWEIPGGKVDRGESMPAAAIRECEEETGVRCQDVQPLIMFHPGLDTLHNPTHVFHSSAFERKAAGDHEGEIVGIGWLPLGKCVDMIFAGEIVDSLSIISILAYAERRRGK
ncbi:MAG: NUDIX hydrolase [Alphaproteobacteria bacterium]